jgi:hypothetical protein
MKLMALKLCRLYLALVVLDVLLIILVIPSYAKVGNLEQGCYLTDALVPYVQCVGFFGSKFASWILNLPFTLIFWPMFGIALFFTSPLLLFGGILLWLPLLYLLWVRVCTLTLRSSGTGQKRPAP